MAKWTSEKIRSALQAIVDEIGCMPTVLEIRRIGPPGLSDAIGQNGGFRLWATRIGLLPNNSPWTEERIERELGEECVRWGRMPSANELAITSRGRLASVVARRGGYRYWAQRLGVEQKETETHRGQKWERHEAKFFRSLNFIVEEQSTRHPFDLLVNGFSVDVKSATQTRHGPSGTPGYIYHGLRRGTDCDFFDLVCIHHDAALHRFIIPAESARVITLTITRSTIAGIGKYSPFRDAIHLLGGTRL